MARVGTGKLDASAALRDRAVSIGLSGAAQIVVFSGVAILGVVGSELLWDPPKRLFLDGELGVPAAFSAGLLLAAGAATLIHVHAAREHRGADRRRDAAGRLLAGFFIFMAVDEALYLHERLEGVAGLSWPVWYLPVAAVGGAAWVTVVRTLDGRARITMVAGAAAWALAIGIETFLYGEGYDQDPVTMPIEELLEMSGSAMFAIGMLRATDALRPDPSPGT